MNNKIDSITATRDVNTEQTNQLFSVYLDGKAPNILKLTHKTNILPPPLPIKLSNRTALVQHIISKLDNSALLHIQGEVGMGKTQLCNLVSENIERSTYWFRIGEYREQLKTFFIELNNIINSSQEFKFLKLFSKDLKIESLSILILDDLPNLVELKVEEDFIQLVMTCEKHNIKILSSSNYNLPDRVNQYTRFIENIHISGLTDDETTEILESYNAPKKIESYAKLINTFSDNHPTLVIATINYLQSNNWDMNFDDFFKNKFIENELQNCQDFLDKTVDKQTKELFYRLNNIGRTVTEEEIQLVSSIEPKIEHPMVKLGTLLNLWIVKESDSEYLLSPLIYKFGSKNLDVLVEKKINLVLAHNIFKEGTVNPYEISKGINYYLKAKEFNTAGFRLFQALHSAMDIDTISENDMFYLHSYWVDTNFPNEMNTATKFLLRTAQIILHNKFGNDTENLYTDYLRLESEIPLTGISSYPLLISYTLFSQNNYKAFEYSLKISDRMNNYSLEDRKNTGIPLKVEGVPVDAVFLFNFDKLTSLDEFKKWVTAIKRLESNKLKEIFDSKIGIESTQPLQHIIEKKLINNIKTIELQELYIILIDLSKYMYSLSIINSWASLVSSASKCLIKDENFNEASILVKDSLLTNDDDAKLIVMHYLAMKYVDKKEYSKALELYIQVIDIEKTLFDATLVDALTYASIAFALTHEFIKAKQYLEKALKIYENTNNYDELILARLYGEYSIVLWHLNLEYECLEACENVMSLIEKNTANLDETWKVTEVVLGHCLGYYVSILSTGMAPEKLEDGDEYVCPKNRFFIYTGDATATLYDINKRFLLYYNLYNSFYQLNDKNKGVIYLHRSFELSKSSSLNDLKIFLYKDIYLVENNFVEYFKFIKSIYSKIDESTIVYLLQLSLIKLIIELGASKNKIEEYKTALIDTYSDVIDEKYLTVIIYTLDVLNGKSVSIDVESDWIIQRIYSISEIEDSSIKRAIEVHKVFYNDFFIVDGLRTSNVIKVEILEKYFFTFWFSKIDKNKSSFSYTAKLLERLNDNYNQEGSSKDKVLELLNLVDRYKKS